MTLSELERIEAAGMIAEDAEFIARAREDVPRLCAEVRRLRAIASQCACYDCDKYGAEEPHPECRSKWHHTIYQQLRE